jgi:hypothetical protein
MLLIGLVVLLLIGGCDAFNPVTSIEISKVIKNDRTDDNPKLETHKTISDEEQIKGFIQALTSGEEIIGIVSYGNGADYHAKVMYKNKEEQEYFLIVDEERLYGQIKHNDQHYSLSKENVKKLFSYLTG